MSRRTRSSTSRSTEPRGCSRACRRTSSSTAPSCAEYKDVFDDLDTLLQGENAFYLRPGNGRVAGVPFKLPELTFVSSPRKADGAKIVDRLLVSKLHLFPTRMTVDGTAVRKVAQGGVGLFYGNVDGRLVFTDVPAGIRGFRHPGASLADGQQYRGMKRPSGLPEKTPGFVYVDIRSTIPFAEKLAQTRIPEDIRRNLKPLGLHRRIRGDAVRRSPGDLLPPDQLAPAGSLSAP